MGLRFLQSLLYYQAARVAEQKSKQHTLLQMASAHLSVPDASVCAQLPPLTRPSLILPLDESRGLFNSHETANFTSSRTPSKSFRIDDGYFMAAVDGYDAYSSQTVSCVSDRDFDNAEVYLDASERDFENAEVYLEGGQIIEF